MILEPGEAIVTAFAEPASGPGWSNSPVWVIVRGRDGKLREECLQPEKFTAEIASLYAVSLAAHAAMKSAVTKSLPARRRKKGDTNGL